MHNVLILALPVTLFLAPSASATLLDDFSDGDDAGWGRHDQLTSGGPGIFDASSGSYVLSSTSTVSVDRESLAADWQDSTLNPAFANGVLTARVRMDNSSTNVALVMRSGLSNSGTYAFAANNNLDLLLISLSTTDADALLASTPFPITDGTEYWLSAQALGSELSLKFWAVGTPEPLVPLLSASDSTLTSGAIELAAYHYGSSDILSASFDDVQFVPEPSTGLLLGLGLVGMAARRRV